MTNRFKKLYDSLLRSGELEQVFPQMTGSWTEDKLLFMEEQVKLEESLLNLNTDYEEDY